MSLGRIALYLVALVVAAALLILGVLVYQGRQAPRTNAPYVALGSSFAAGLGLGARSPGSPFVCQRSVNGYPQQLARMTGLTLVDMSCSGATAAHVLRGGQVFLGPQIDAIGPDTQLVTITAGGNDVGYVGDLTAMAFRNRGGVMGFLTGRFWKGARPVADRPFNQLQDDMIAGLREIRRRAPKAQIMVMTYPAILPEDGSCPLLGIDTAQAAQMRPVGVRLAQVTRAAAKAVGATLIDVDVSSRGHDACATTPWVNGAAPAQGAPFHPTLAGAQGVAGQIMPALHKAPPR